MPGRLSEAVPLLAHGSCAWARVSLGGPVCTRVLPRWGGDGEAVPTPWRLQAEAAI